MLPVHIAKCLSVGKHINTEQQEKGVISHDGLFSSGKLKAKFLLGWPYLPVLGKNF